jgi:hypothetical protein
MLEQEWMDPGAMTEYPEWTVRMAASRNSGSALLSRHPLAPARAA